MVFHSLVRNESVFFDVGLRTGPETLQSGHNAPRIADPCHDPGARDARLVPALPRAPHLRTAGPETA